MATILQILGSLVITAGIAMFSIPIATIIGGIFVLLFGIAMERNSAK